jgi:dTDP-4-dehydrorhamnose 3,5-epimerase
VKVIPTNLRDCFIIEPSVYVDHRGHFLEVFNKRALEEELNHSIDFVQDNLSVSKNGVLRGLHFQKGADAQAKLVQVIKGEVLDVVVDLRKDSPTFKQHFKTRLSDQKIQLLFIPKGMAHGFLALQEDTVFTYKCDAYYEKEAESGIIYNDAELGIDWEFPEADFILSEKDQKLPRLRDLVL